MCWVGSIAAEAAARDHDVDRWRLPFHRADLHGGGLGSKEQVGTAGDVGVHGGLQRPRRMVGGHVQRLEVVPVGLEFGPLANSIPERGENVDDLSLRLRQWMERTGIWSPAGQRHVDALRLGDRPVSLGAESRISPGEGSAEGFEYLIDGLADEPTVLLGQGAQRLLDPRDRRLPPKKGDLRLM